MSANMLVSSSPASQEVGDETPGTLVSGTPATVKRVGADDDLVAAIGGLTIQTRYVISPLFLLELSDLPSAPDDVFLDARARESRRAGAQSQLSPMASTFTPAKLPASSSFSTDVGETTRHIIVEARWSVSHEVKRLVNVSLLIDKMPFR
jgi:hypothetical protein